MNILGKLWGPELEATYPAQPHGVGPGATVSTNIGFAHSQPEEENVS